MDRSLSTTSVDNALDSLIMKATKFPRSDSEDQFRKFLERIPSTTNLANYSGSMQSLPQIQQQGLQLVSTGAPLTAHLPEGGSLNVGGIPRVPSLDLLRQLVAQQQHQGQNGSAKLPAMSTALKEDPEGPGASSSPGSAEAVCLAETSLAPGLPAASALSLPLPASSFGQSGGSSSQVTTVMPLAPALTGAHAKEPQKRDSKAEIRRARRMLSNRESARRSRRRKQEHLGQLEEQIAQLEEEKDAVMQQLEKLEKQAKNHADQNTVLREENEELRQQLGLEARDKKSGSHPHKKQCQGVNQ